MLKQRVITACILALLVLLAIFVFPPRWFQAFIALVLCAGAWEWSRLAGLQQIPARACYVALFLPLLYMLMHVGPALRNGLLLLSLCWWLLALVLVKCYPRCSRQWSHPAVLLSAGLLVLLPGWLGLLYLRALDFYVVLILLLMLLVSAADMGAYFAGRRFGKHKLSPAVSPNKTWEGFAGGQLATCTVLWIFLAICAANAWPVSISLVLKATLGTLLVASSSVVGDLFESMIKRQANVKDSGVLLPGHGGVLDRIDSLTVAIPVYAFVLLNAGLL
jgi:phosphatidate cytidylyltransferase